jgi:hypothetical protein
MSQDDLTNKLSESGIPESSMSTIISSIIKHLIYSGESKESSINSRGATGDTKADADKDVQAVLSSIDKLSPNHPLVQRIQQDTGIQDPQLVTQYTEQTLRVMKEHANESPERMRSIFRRFRSRKGEVKDQEQNLDGSFLHDGYDSF